MTLLQARLTLEAALDKISGEPGRGAALSKQNRGAADQFGALAQAIANHAGAEVSAAAEEMAGGRKSRRCPICLGTGETPQGNACPKCRGGEAPKSQERGAAVSTGPLAKYEELLASDPAEAGRFYSKNADAIAEGFAERQHAQAAERRRRHLPGC